MKLNIRKIRKRVLGLSHLLLNEEDVLRRVKPPWEVKGFCLFSLFFRKCRKRQSDGDLLLVLPPDRTVWTGIEQNESADALREVAVSSGTTSANYFCFHILRSSVFLSMSF